ncbi:MAG: glycosyltransferase [bacterium]
MKKENIKVAIIHYWLINWRGGEKVIESLCKMYPNADIFTHVVSKRKMPKEIINTHKINTTFISKLPFSKKLYQAYLPLMPLALEVLDLTKYDLVISSESGPAKGVITRPDALHICYCHSPMRYIWDMHYDYLKKLSKPKSIIFSLLAHRLRTWDQISSLRPDYFIANSNFVMKRIEKCYRRESTVIHPPVQTKLYKISDEIDDYYLFAGQLVSYKRADIAIKAFNSNKRKLIVLGEGTEQKHLEKEASSNIIFLGRQSSEKLQEYFSKCRALIFPGIEDFGILPIEVMASGRPVIAFKAGGALDYIIDKKTGIFFDKQTSESLNEAIENFEKNEDNFIPSAIKEFSESFSEEIFRKNMASFIKNI